MGEFTGREYIDTRSKKYVKNFQLSCYRPKVDVYRPVRRRGATFALRAFAQTAAFFQLSCWSAGFCAPSLRPNPNSSANCAVSIQPQTFYVCQKSKKDNPCLNPKSLRQSARVQTLSKSRLGIKRSTTLLDGMVSGQPRQARSHKTNQHKPANCNFF